MRYCYRSMWSTNSHRRNRRRLYKYTNDYQQLEGRHTLQTPL